MTLDYSISLNNGYDKDAYTYVPVIIIGAGESGIAMGCRLREKLGFDQFRIFDRQSGMGGTWWINRYPGVACDVPAIFYSFSWCPNYTAPTLYPEGRDILKYLQGVASKYEIVDKVQLDTDVSELRYLEDEEVWEATLTYLAPGFGDKPEKERQQHIAEHGKESVYLRQEKIRAKVVISCVGVLVEPNSWPESIPGRDVFEGDLFHTARWKTDVDVQGKDVVIVGTGCSAAQVIPSILKEPYNAKSVTQVMRTPPWVGTKLAEPFGEETFARYAPSVFGYMPVLGRIFRTLMFLGAETEWFQLFLNNESSVKGRKQNEADLLKRMRRLAPEKYHEMLTPNYSIGCKRRIFDPERGWYAAMNDPKYRLTTQPLLSIQAKSITLGAARDGLPTVGEHIPADAIFLANGYDATQWLHPLKVFGKGGRSMHDVWDERGGPQAYLGSAVDGFPNFFIVFGPNTATGHASVILATENMVELTLKMVAPILKGNVRTVEVKKEAEIEYTNEIQRDLQKTVFMGGGCKSWYSNGEGWNSIVYPRSQFDYTYRCLFPNYSDWNFELTPQGLLRQRLRKAISYATLASVILGTFWARRGGNSLVGVLQRFMKDGLRATLAAIGRGTGHLQQMIS